MNFGTEPRKLVRRNDPETSRAAAESVNSESWEEKVYRVIKEHGAEGATQDQVLAAIYRRYGMVPYSTVTARFKALEEGGLIKYSGATREGVSGRQSRVRVATCWIGQQELF